MIKSLHCLPHISTLGLNQLTPIVVLPCAYYLSSWQCSENVRRNYLLFTPRSERVIWSWQWIQIVRKIWENFFSSQFSNFFFFTSSSKFLKISLHVLLAVHWLNVNLLGIAEVKFCSCNRWLNVFFFLFLWMLNCTIVVNFFVLRGFVITYKCSDI